MASLPNFPIEATSGRSVISSYRRSQILVAESTVASAVDSIAPLGAGQIRPQHDQYIDSDVECGVGPWQDDVFEGESDSEEDVHTPVREVVNYDAIHSAALVNELSVGAGESTPLLRKGVSFSTYAQPHRDRALVRQPSTIRAPSNSPHSNSSLHPRRRHSASSVTSVRYSFGGQSTFGQTLFNSVAILVGIGILSEPLAFAYAGWFGGTLLIAFYGYISCYTAKLLARAILQDPRLLSYGDIGRKAFGPKSTPFISALFCLELFSVSVVLVTLYADSLHTIAPAYSANTYKLWGLVVLIPTVFLPLSLLSYTSILGIISTVLLILVLIVDGLTKPTAPGSLWNPAETSLGIGSLSQLGGAFGLFMAGFSGHAVIPSLVRDMTDPSQFSTVIDRAFFIATSLYGLIGYAGYLMFGNSVSDEISMDLLRTPGYNQALNDAVLWMLVITPLTKFALATRPLNITLEVMLGLDSSSNTVSREESGNSRTLRRSEGPINKLNRIAKVFERVTFTILSVTVSMLVPDFGSTMAFMGSFSAFVICVIGPIAANIAMLGRVDMFDGTVLVIVTIMSVWGTIVAFRV